MTMTGNTMRTSRGFHVVMAGISVALLLTAWMFLTLTARVNGTQVQVRVLRHTVSVLEQQNKQLRLLVRALQEQVRECRTHPRRCGPPLTVPPEAHESTTPQASPQPPPNQPSRSPAPSPSSSPSRSPHPTPSPTRTRTPSPSPTCLLILCISPEPLHGHAHRRPDQTEVHLLPSQAMWPLPLAHPFHGLLVRL